MADHTDTTFVVTTDTASQTAYKVRAAHVGVDERIFPGWTILKNAAGTIVALVRSERVLMINRLDEPAPVPAVKPGPPGGPSPAVMPPFQPPTTGAASTMAYSTSSPRP